MSEITVSVSDQKDFSPDQMQMRVTFFKNCVTTEEASSEIDEIIRDVSDVLSRTDINYKFVNSSIREVRDKDEDVMRAIVVFNITTDADLKEYRRVRELLSDLPHDQDLSLNFSLKNREEAEEEVLSSCFSKAEKRASLLAASAGEKLGKIISIRHEDYHQPMLLRAASQAPEIESISISQSLTITWESEER